MSRHFQLYWTDLTFEKQQDLINEIKSDMLEEAEKEGNEFLKRSWYNPQPKTWQEAYVRTYAIDFRMWEDYEKTGADGDKPDFNYLLDNHFDEKAEEQCQIAVKGHFIEI